MTFDLCRRYVDKWITVTEKEISDVLYMVLEKGHKVCSFLPGSKVIPGHDHRVDHKILLQKLHSYGVIC